MSNTSYTSPYRAQQRVNVSANATQSSEACMKAVGAAVKWLLDEDQISREQKIRMRREDSQGRLHRGGDALLGFGENCVVASTLHLLSSESLLETARCLGYSTQRVDRDASGELTACLSDAAGRRVVFHHGPSAGVTVYSAVHPQAAQEIVRNHTLHQAKKFLEENGMRMEVRTLENGETEISAQEPTHPAKGGGAAMVTTRVHADGTSRIEIDCVEGRRCTDIVGRLSKATGSEVVKSTPKPAYYRQARREKRLHVGRSR